MNTRLGLRILKNAHTRFQVARSAVSFDLRNEKGLNPWRLYQVPVRQIEYFQTGSPGNPVYTYRGMGSFDKRCPGILGGPWDLEVTPICETLVYRGFHERFVTGIPWSDTCLNPEHVKCVHPSDGRRWTTANFAQLCSRYDKLFSSMEQNGWRRSHYRESFYDHLTLNIGRDGRLIRNSSGQHRLIIARLLGIERAPARFLIVHEGWEGVTKGVPV
jgi:hypothetical protein